MKFARIMLPLVCSVPILLGCSTPAVAPGTTATALKIEPLLRVRDAAGSASDFYQLGRYYQGQNRFAQAADAYRKALEYRKDDIEARNALATTYAAQGKLDQAIAEFEAILKIKPELARLHNNLGYAYYLQGDFGRAVGAFKTAMALEPRDPRTYNNLGLAYRKMGESEKSRLAFARVAELEHPDTAAGADVVPSASPPPATAAGGGNIASVRPSVALQGQTPSIDLPPLPASVALNPGAAGTARTAADPNQPPVAPYLLAHRGPESIALDAGQERAERQSAAVVPVPVPATAAPSPAMLDVTAAAKPYRLEIANGNGVTGLARKVGAKLLLQGLPPAHLINLKPYREPASSIRYRDGFDAQAQQLGQHLGHAPAVLGNQHLPRGVDVQLVLGRDAMHPVALFGDEPEPAQLARKTAAPAEPAS